MSSEDVLRYHSQARNGICLLLWGFKNLRIHWRIWRILKTKNKSVWSNNFWYVKVYIFWNFNQCTNWDKTQMLHCFSLARLNSSQFYFHSFTFNSQLLYELKHKVHLSENVCGIFYFQFCLGFIQVYIFVPQKGWSVWL